MLRCLCLRLALSLRLLLCRLADRLNLRLRVLPHALKLLLRALPNRLNLLSDSLTSSEKDLLPRCSCRRRLTGAQLLRGCHLLRYGLLCGLNLLPCRLLRRKDSIPRYFLGLRDEILLLLNSRLNPCRCSVTGTDDKFELFHQVYRIAPSTRARNS